jgi:hypothetical protein
VITFTVNPDASISVDEDLVVCIDGIATLTSTLTGSSSSATVQWQSSASASGPWSDISGATSSLYSAPTTAIGVTYYRARVIDVVSGCDQAISNSVSVTVEEDAEITASANNSEVCIDGSVILTAATTGGSGELTIQWQDGPGVTGPWTDIAGETNTTYSPSTSVAGTYYYRVFVIDPLSGCGQPATDPITIVVNPDVTLDVSANNSNVCVGGNVTITATVGGGSSSRTLQWQSGTSTTGPWTAIPGATTGAYTAPTTTAGTYYYRLQVSDPLSGCSEPVSDVITVTVYSDPTVNVNVNNAIVCIGGTALLTATTGGGSGTFSYQWQSAPSSSGPWSNITNATNATYSASTASEGDTHYRVVLVENVAG